MSRTLSIQRLGAAIALGALTAAAGAKIPAPVLTDEQKAKAAEATARTGWSNQVANFQLCRAMDKVAARYHAEARSTGKEPKPAAAAAVPALAAAPAASAAPAAAASLACADPGPFAHTPPPAKPIEAAGAHSPPETAKGPPSGTAPAATQTPVK